MTELKCLVKNCTYNDSQCCCKGDNMVGGMKACSCDDTCCESFREQKEGSARNALDHPSRMISIDCEAVKCMYNTNYKCSAEHVDIKGIGADGSRETLCATFTER